MESEAKIRQIVRGFERGMLSESKKATIARYMFLAELLFPCDNVLDIGINSGVQLSILSSRANAVTGIDLEKLESQVAAFNNRYLKNVLIRQMDAESLDFPNNSFDIVSSFECIEHVQDPKKMLSEIARVVKPDGIIMISTPNRDVTGSRLLSRAHKREWTFVEFKELLEQFFTIKAWYGQKITRGNPRQKLYTDIRSSFIYDVYERMPTGARSLASRIFQKATLGDSWQVKPLNVSADEKSLVNIAILINPKKSRD